jgi:uncharacterized protein
MDESGVDVQVLSVTTPALHNLEPEESVILARHTNDLVAATIAKCPARFQGFATLPTAAPAEAALELEQSVQHLGLAGAMVCGRTRDTNLDHRDFRPILQTAARLDVPVFVHPQIPQRGVREVYYSGFGDPIDAAFATFSLGWHYEAVGPKRILFSTDYPYPYRPGRGGRSFLDKASVSLEEKELFAHGNWERVTRSVPHQTVGC